MSSGGYEQNDERVRNVLSQTTIDKAVRDHELALQAQNAARAGSQGEPERPGITRRETATRRDPLTGDLIEEYVGNNADGPAVRAHYNWDEPGKAPTNMPQSQQVQRGNADPRPGQVHRTNTNISYTAAGDRVEEHDGEGSLQVRALYNEDDDPSNTYRPSGPQRHQSDRGAQGRY